ncbi:hypothetical protein MLD38_008154 [Melastoma candidum]|uniref:Uncharacterized protein n=1 Tax=Melastoma candidum TaxID=119954 RepID=A0ACB9RSI7_9MYRT|nr:hypothetical protein MLD38_008154 [Melastoma candidum]
MAVRCLESACKSARSTWSLGSIAVAHRLGPVPVGETSVFVAVSSVHRVDALDACKFLIDEIKASVPIWKKEVYTDGEVWKENKEFLERMPVIGEGGRSENKAFSSEVHKRSSCCCGGKVRVDQEEEDLGL